MNKNIKQITAITIMIALLAGCFATLPLQVNAAVVKEEDFDYNVDYYISDQWVLKHGDVIVNTWFKDGRFWGNTKDIDGTAPSNSIYKFEVRDSLTDDYNAYTAFCAYYGANAFGENTAYQFGTLDAGLKADILLAFNYIYDKHGSIDSWQIDVDNVWNGQLGQPYDRPITVEGSTRVLSQIVLWMLLDDNIDEMKAQYAYPGGPDYSPCFGVFDDAVSEVLDAVRRGDVVEGVITDIAYLVGPNFPNDEITIQPQIIPIIGDTKTPEIQLKKTVNGIAVDLWLPKGLESKKDEILSGIVFDLYQTMYNPDTNERKIDPTRRVDIGSGTVGADGIIVFDFGLLKSLSLGAGWYAIQERYIPGSLAEMIFKGTAPTLFIYIDGDGKFGKVFDYESQYTIVNGFNWAKHNAGLGYTGLNNGGDLFYIGVKSVNNGIEYASFCAHGGSRNFAGESGMGCSEYMIVQRTGMGGLANPEMDTSYEAILAALNWIEDNVGSLQATDGPYGLVTTQRVVAQTVIWALLKNIDVTSTEFATVNLTYDERAYVMDALDAAKTGYKGSIVDLVYMVCEHGHDFYDCQPQLVPIYAGFNNRLIDDPTGALEVSASAILKTTKETILKKLQREVTPYEEWTQYLTQSYGSVTATTPSQWALRTESTVISTKNGNALFGTNGFNPLVVSNSNHFTYAKLDKEVLDAGGVVDLVLVVGNKFDQVGKGTAFINAEGKLELIFDDFYAGKFGAVAFDGFMPNVKNGNLHSVGIFKHDSNDAIAIYTKASFQSTDKKGVTYDKDWADIIAKPAEEEGGYIYLYVHLDPVQFKIGEPVQTNKWTIEGEYEVKCEKVLKTTTVETELEVTVTVYDSEDNVVDPANFGKLKPGAYKIVYYDAHGDVTETEDVTIIAGETITAEGYFAEYFEDAEPRIITKYLPDIVNPVVIINKTAVKK